MDEFELIRRYFTRASGDDAVLVGVGDDGAVLQPATDRALVAVVDTLVDGVHYPSSLAAEDVGFRGVAVNLSDIAAMGARPRWMTLGLTLTEANPDWLHGFSSGLFAAADEHSVALVGGDTTRGEQIVVSVQIIGDVDRALVMTRSAARPGDAIFVSGTLGDAAAGLRALQTATTQNDDREFLVTRFRRPAARISLGERIARLASAAIDISDGLHADLEKLLDASGCGAQIDIDRLPLSDALLGAVAERETRQFALSGGDDYELCFTAAPSTESALVGIGEELGIRITRIGQVTEGDRIVCMDAGTVVKVDGDGYVHFRSAGG